MARAMTFSSGAEHQEREDRSENAESDERTVGRLIVGGRTCQFVRVGPRVRSHGAELHRIGDGGIGNVRPDVFVHQRRAGDDNEKAAGA